MAKLLIVNQMDRFMAFERGELPLYHKPTGPRRSPKQPAVPFDCGGAVRNSPQCRHFWTPAEIGPWQNRQMWEDDSCIANSFRGVGGRGGGVCILNAGKPKPSRYRRKRRSESDRS
jgi:hypothetical protein